MLFRSAYYNIYEQTRREHPALLFEICNDGGRMVDFGSAAHGDYFSITDTYDPLSNRRAFFDTSYTLPAAMLESYVEKWPVPRIENFLYMLRSGMMGWTSIMLDTTVWSTEQHDAARQAIALYKRELRPLIRDAHLYHVSARPDGVHWDGMEYCDPARGKGVLSAFRGSVPDESEHRFVLAGLDAHKHYLLHFQDGSAPDRQAMGSELMDQGLLVELRHPLSSELVFLAEAPGNNRPSGIRPLKRSLFAWSLFACGLFGGKGRNDLFQFREALFQSIHIFRFGCFGRLRRRLLSRFWRLDRRRIHRCASCGKTGILNEFKRIDCRRHGPIGILIDVKHGLHISERGVLAGASGSHDHLAQYVQRKLGIGRFRIFDNDLSQNEASDIFAGCRIDDADVVTLLQHLGDFFKIDVAAVCRIIKAPIFIFFDQY